MLKKLLATPMALTSLMAMAQDTTKKAVTKISGSVDAYYRYNIDDVSGGTNNYTSFTNTKNSFELGMATLKLDHSVGKVSATADLGFGKRAQEFSYNDGGSLASVKQLFVSYAVSDKLKFTLGKWATHVGYELVDAIGNKNYSMSYGFSYGPFFHTGLKADISLGGKTALMVGVANPTDYSTTTSSTKFAIAQLSTATKNDKVKFYLNFQGATDITQFDLVVTGAVSSKFTVGYDGTIQTNKATGTSQSWSSNALYLTYDAKNYLGFTLRGEYFDDKKATSSGAFGTSIFATTLSANYKVESLTIIPEVRLDAGKDPLFSKSNGDPTKSTVSFILAATYAF